MRQFLEYIVSKLVNRPDDVRITEFDGKRTVAFELRCHENDLGKVIGKNGKTVGAIRSLLNVLAARRDRKVILEVVD